MFRNSVAIIIFFALLPFSALAQDSGWVDYEDGLVNQFMSEGNTVLVLYTVPWCNACVSQETAIDKFREENPAYEAIKFVRVNWDEFENRPIVRDWDVFGRSTILLVRTGGELGNIFADTSRSEIKALLDLGLTASE